MLGNGGGQHVTSKVLKRVSVLNEDSDGQSEWSGHICTMLRLVKTSNDVKKLLQDKSQTHTHRHTDIERK